jgi:hypothetical protein
MTCRRAAEPERARAPSGADLGFEVDHVGTYPGNPIRCVLYRDGELTRVRVNEAWGEVAWDHAAHHFEAGVDGLGFVCRVGMPCGYGGDPAYLARMASD